MGCEAGVVLSAGVQRDDKCAGCLADGAAPHVVFTRQSQFIEESDTVQALASTLVEASKNSSTFDAEYSIVGMDCMLGTKLRSPLKFVDGHFDRTRQEATTKHTSLNTHHTHTH